MESKELSQQILVLLGSFPEKDSARNQRVFMVVVIRA
jgi:hypothetical protein